MRKFLLCVVNGNSLYARESPKQETCGFVFSCGVWRPSLAYGQGHLYLQDCEAFFTLNNIRLIMITSGSACSDGCSFGQILPWHSINPFQSETALFFEIGTSLKGISSCPVAHYAAFVRHYCTPK